MPSSKAWEAQKRIAEYLESRILQLDEDKSEKRKDSYTKKLAANNHRSSN